MKKFSEKLKESRIEKDWTQEDLSKVTGVPKRTIEDWERGVRTPPIWTQKMILTFLKRSREMKVFEVWDKITNEKITEVIAGDKEEAWIDFIENCDEYVENYDIENAEIRRAKPVT